MKLYRKPIPIYKFGDNLRESDNLERQIFFYFTAMIYKTVYGEFKGKYIEAKGGVYWLIEPIIHRGMGYALLYKTYRGSYEVIKILRV